MSAWKIARKDLRILFYDIPGLLYLFITPIIVIAVASFALSGLFGTTVEKFDLPIVVEDQGEYANNLLHELRDKSAFHLVETYKDKHNKLQPMTVTESEKLVHKTKVALIIPQGFSEAIQQGGKIDLIVIKDPVDTIIPNLVSNALNKYINGLMLNKLSHAAGVAYIDGSAIGITYQELAKGDDHVATPFDSNVPGYAVMFVLLGTASAAAALIEERENGTLRKLRTLPISNYAIIGGKMLSNFMTATLQCMVLFAVGHWSSQEKCSLKTPSCRKTFLCCV